MFTVTAKITFDHWQHLIIPDYFQTDRSRNYTVGVIPISRRKSVQRA